MRIKFTSTLRYTVPSVSHNKLSNLFSSNCCQVFLKSTEVILSRWSISALTYGNGGIIESINFPTRDKVVVNNEASQQLQHGINRSDQYINVPSVKSWTNKLGSVLITIVHCVTLCNNRVTTNFPVLSLMLRTAGRSVYNFFPASQEQSSLLTNTLNILLSKLTSSGEITAPAHYDQKIKK